MDEIVRYAAKTPSDAAHLLIDGMSQQQQRLTTLYESIETILTTYQENCWRTATDRYEAIQQSCTETKKRLEERVDAWRDAIQMMNPLHQLDRGYALVYDAQHEYITKQKINGLQS